MGAFDDIIAQYGSTNKSPVLRGLDPPDPSQTYRGIQGLIREGSSSAADFFSKLAALPGKIMNDPGLNILPMPMGLVLRGPTAAVNAAKLAEQIGTKLDALKAAGGEVTPFEYSKAYLSSKYPNLYAAAPSITENPNLSESIGGTTGMYTGMVQINPNAYIPPGWTPRQGQVESLGHELIHSLQAQRPEQDLAAYRERVSPLVSDAFKVFREGGEGTPEFKSLTDRLNDAGVRNVLGFTRSNPESVLEAYQEGQAYPAGRTALSTYNTFQNMTTSPWGRAAGAVKNWLGF